jgi:hypothetical protein
MLFLNQFSSDSAKMIHSVTVATDIISHSAYDTNKTQESDKEQWLCNPKSLEFQAAQSKTVTQIG